MIDILAETPIVAPTAGTVTVITPCVVGGKNYETYWVLGSKLLLATRVKTAQARRPNDFRSTSVITKNCTEGLPDEKNISMEKSKSKITHTI